MAKDKKFYEEALQKRFDQMEAFENKADGLEEKVKKLQEEVRRGEGDVERARSETIK